MLIIRIARCFDSARVSVTALSTLVGDHVAASLARDSLSFIDALSQRPTNGAARTSPLALAPLTAPRSGSTGTRGPGLWHHAVRISSVVHAFVSCKVSALVVFATRN